MEILIRPDDKRPNGGYATLTLIGHALPEPSAAISVIDAYSQRHLGEQGWQSEPASFGPYPVTDVSNGVELTVGPEIVNQLEEYTSLELNIGGIKVSTSWPDDVVPAPGAAIIGGLYVTEPAEAKSVLREEVVLPKETSVEDETPEEEAVNAAALTDDTVILPVANSGGKAKIFIPILLLLIVIAGAAYWYFTQNTDPETVAPVVEPEPVVVVEPTPVPEPAPTADPCSSDAFDALRGQGFAASEALLRQCGGSVSADTALEFLEDGAKADEAVALLMFGKIYDKDAIDDDLESKIGLSFQDNPATAATYYSRARETGSAEAAVLLEALCQRMATMTDTLTTGAFQDHCSE